jgi:tetratricopeptide (TPR) repeat protein
MRQLAILVISIFFPIVSLVMAETTELPDKIYDKVTLLSEEGNSLAEDSKYQAAIAKYNEAMALLPAPVEKWEACTWLSAAIGDAYFLDSKFMEAISPLSKGMKCPDAIGNPFMHLRLGQAYFEIGDMSKAADELTRAYMLEGKGIFKYEDKKYFDFLKTKIKPPKGEEW